MSSPITVDSERALRAELDRLKTETRPAVIAALTTAREHGDLKENAEYHAAREEQSFVEGRIAHIEQKLAQAQVIDVRKIKPTGKVIFGTTVELIDVQKDVGVTYKIVGEDEANIERGLLNAYSPVARMILGKATGDRVTIKVPAGTFNYEIKSIRHL